MRICYINYEWDLEASTGAATQIAQTVGALERLGHQVVVVERHRRPPGTPGNGAPGRASPWLWEAANHARSLTGMGPEIHILRREQPDVVLVLHALRFSALAAARWLGLPVVLEVNASVPDEIRRFKPWLRLLPGLSEWIERRMLESADAVFVVSGVLKSYFVERGLDAGRVAVIPNGADPARFCPRAADPALRARFPGKTLVGFAGSFARFHGLEPLERVMAEAATRDPSLHFVLAGPGGDLERRYRGPNAAFLGRLPYEKVPGMTAAMDILVAPYAPQQRFYFSPLKLFEYMASGRAVLAARMGQIAEVIEEGINGLLYDPAQPEELIEKLLALGRSPALRERLGGRARQTILANFTWDHHARRVSELLEQARRRATSSPLQPLAEPGAGGRWSPARRWFARWSFLRPWG